MFTIFSTHILVGGLEHQFYFPINIGFLIIPMDGPYFSEGWPNHQPVYQWPLTPVVNHLKHLLSTRIAARGRRPRSESRSCRSCPWRRRHRRARASVRRGMAVRVNSSCKSEVRFGGVLSHGATPSYHLFLWDFRLETIYFGYHRCLWKPPDLVPIDHYLQCAAPPVISSYKLVYKPIIDISSIIPTSWSYVHQVVAILNWGTSFLWISHRHDLGARQPELPSNSER